MKPLPQEQIDELHAVLRTTTALGKPTFIHRSNWREGYAQLVRRGLVTWAANADFGAAFAAVALTDAGRQIVRTNAASPGLP